MTMGTLVTFRPRAEDAAAKTEAILSKIGELYQKKVKAKEALPGVLATMIEHGEHEFVIRAVMLWGSGEMEAHEVMAMCEEYAAVAGITLVGNRPF
jgi:hypothetical protein